MSWPGVACARERPRVSNSTLPAESLDRTPLYAKLRRLPASRCASCWWAIRAIASDVKSSSGADDREVSGAGPIGGRFVRALAGGSEEGPGSGGVGWGRMVASLRKMAWSVGHFCIQAVLCLLVWWLAVRFPAIAYPAKGVAYLVMLVLGLAGLGVLARTCRGGRFEVAAAVWLASMAVRLVFFSGDYWPASRFWRDFWMLFADHAPFVSGLTVLPLIGWYAAGWVMRRRRA